MEVTRVETLLIWVITLLIAGRGRPWSRSSIIIMKSNLDKKVGTSKQASFGWWFQLVFMFIPILGNDPI